MSSVLIQLSVLLGSVLFLLSLGVALVNGVSLLTALFRAVIVMCAGTVVSAAFFRFFLGVLYRFIDEKMMEQTRIRAQAAAKAAGGAAMPGG